MNRPRRLAGPGARWLVLCVATWTGCAAPGGDPTPAAGDPGGGRVIVGVRGDVSSFNIYTATNAFSQDVADLLFPRLAEESSDFAQGPPTFLPGLATEWSFSEDRRNLTFRLRQDMVWSDGQPISSEDVAFSFRAASHPGVGWVGSDVKERIEGVGVPDARTLVFRFGTAYPYQLMDAVEGHVLPAHVFGRTPFEDWPRTAFLEASVTGGPFRLRRYERGSLIELERNPDFVAAPLPRLAGLVFRIIPEPRALVNELLAGKLDLLPNVPEDLAGSIEGDERFEILRASDLSYTFICWNTTRPPFDDVRVRRALSLAIDRAAIVEGLLPRTGRLSNGPVPSLLWAADPELESLPHDPAEALELLRAAGFRPNADGKMERRGRPLRFELETNTESTLRSAVAEMIAAQLRRVGIDAVLRRYEFGAFVTRHEAHDFDAFLGSWRESTKVDLKSVFHSASIDHGYNYGGYTNPELDEVIDRARSEIDPGRATDGWRRAQRLVAAELPLTFLYEKDRLHALRKGLRGFAPNPRTVYADVAGWHWDPAPE